MSSSSSQNTNQLPGTQSGGTGLNNNQQQGGGGPTGPNQQQGNLPQHNFTPEQQADMTFGVYEQAANLALGTYSKIGHLFEEVRAHYKKRPRDDQGPDRAVLDPLLWTLCAIYSVMPSSNASFTYFFLSFYACMAYCGASVAVLKNSIPSLFGTAKATVEVDSHLQATVIEWSTLNSHSNLHPPSNTSNIPSITAPNQVHYTTSSINLIFDIPAWILNGALSEKIMNTIRGLCDKHLPSSKAENRNISICETAIASLTMELNLLTGIFDTARVAFKHLIMAKTTKDIGDILNGLFIHYSQTVTRVQSVVKDIFLRLYDGKTFVTNWFGNSQTFKDLDSKISSLIKNNSR